MRTCKKITKQADVVRRLRDAIRDGSYEEGGRIPPESRLAREYGVSTITMNKALGELVRAGFLARGGSTRGGTILRTRAPFPLAHIAFLMANHNRFHQLILEGACRAAYGLNVAIWPITTVSSEVDACVRKLEGGCCAGIISGLADHLDTSLPVLYVDNTINRNSGARHIRCDSRRGGALLARALLDAGHRDIVLMVSFPHLHVPRCEGFLLELRQAGIDTLRRLIHVTLEDANIRNTLRRVLRLFPGTTAIAADTDHTAFQVLRAAQALGLPASQRLTFTGFGNLPEIQCLCPFATIEQLPGETGFRAVSEMVAWIEDDACAPPHVQELEVALVNGDRIANVAEGRQKKRVPQKVPRQRARTDH